MLTLHKNDLMGIVRRHGFDASDFSLEETQDLDHCALKIRFRTGDLAFTAVEYPEKRDLFFTNWTRSLPGHPWVADNLEGLLPLDGKQLCDYFDYWLVHEVETGAASEDRAGRTV